MKIRIRARDVRLTNALREHVESRLGFALSRFGEHVDRIAVDLSRSNEIRDRAEKRCRIAVGLPRCVKVQETDADVFSAVARAADRMGRSVALAIEAERTRVPGRTQPWKDKRPKPGVAAPLVPRLGAGRSRIVALKHWRASAGTRKWRPGRDV